MLLLEIPQETKEHIFMLCRPKDLCNFALCGRKAYNDVKSVLWSQMTIDWCLVDKPTPRIIGTHHFPLLTSIHFSYFGICAVRTYGDGATNLWRFEDIIKSCNPDRLKTLSLSCYIIPKGLRVASSHLKLVTELKLYGIYLRSKDWKDIYLFKLVRSLELHNCDIADENLQNLSKFAQLSRLSIVCCRKLSWKSFEHVRMLPALIKLVFNCRAKMEEKSCQPINNLESLEHLELYGSGAESSYFDPILSKLNDIRILGLSGLSDKSFVCISRMRALVSLEVRDSSVTHKGLEYLAQLEKLHTLDLSFCEQVNDDGMLNISKIKSLTKLLVLRSPLVTDEGVKHISSLPLKFLRIGRDNLTDDCFVFLAKMEKLETLVMRHCNGPNGFGVKHLTKLKHLRSADFRFCRNMDEALVFNAELCKNVDVRWQYDGRMLP